MKKVFLMTLALGLMVCFAACKHEKKVELSSQKAELNVENVVSADRQQMYLNYGGDYRWYETCILLNNFLDEETDTLIAGVSNVFQVVTEFDSSSFDVHVILFAHTPDTSSVTVKEGFWVEDYPMNEDSIRISFKEAYDLIMATNYPKPHSKHCVLRKEIGPKECNPQYIFGNSHAQLYVDAVTGKVSPENPAFEGLNMGCPLGEWP